VSDEIALNFIQQGKGDPPIVFVHGYLCRHQDWREQIAYFGSSHAVVACDLRGLGQSPRGTAPMSIETLGTDVANLIEFLDLRRVVLVGHSMGCRVVMETYGNAMDRISGLVLVDGSRGAVDRDEAFDLFNRVIAAIGYRTFASNLFEGMFFGDYPPTWKDESLKNALAVPKDIGLPLYQNLVRWDADKSEAAMDAIAVPVLVLQSTYMNLERKRVMLGPGQNSPYQDLVAERVADATSETIAGVGHFSMIEAADVVNRAIEQFIAARVG
jgi:pimeloyl-ACP methyl ester carboxylesterase